MTNPASPDVYYFWDTHRRAYIGSNGCCTHAAPRLFTSPEVCARALQKGGFYINLSHILVCRMTREGLWTWPGHIFLSDHPTKKRTP